MKQLKVKIVENKKIAPHFYKMRVESVYLARNTKPGQFFEVKCSDGAEPLLRRPLGAHRILRNGVEMLYEVVGKGTELLSRRKIGESLDIIGPLGNGFTLYAKRYALNAILIAGGIGVAPLVALAQKIAYRKKAKTYVLIGAKTKSHILCEDEFKKLGCEVVICTEYGLKGKNGLATDLLKDLLNAKRYPLNAIIYACGPAPMLKAVAEIAERKHIPCQVSLEERMACGVGACLGCPVKIRTGGYKMVCSDGPVFDAKEIAW